jgi:protein arginine N-methyltransferase 1
MYDLIGYGSMIADDVRTGSYARVLRECIVPGSVVADIGTGTGLFALLACRFGARRVYAIEPDNAIALARETARLNGCLDRITFIQNMSTRVTLPESVDVVVSDIRGILPFCLKSLQSIIDARRRFLASGGLIIPRRDRMMVAVVDAPDLYADHTKPWNTRIQGLDMSPANHYVTNIWRKARVEPEQLLLAPRCWADLDYVTLESPNASGEAQWTVERAGTAHGLSVWFDSDLTDSVHLTNAPGEPELIYGSAFFPFSKPVRVAEGDGVQVSLRADLVGEDYVWSWNTRIRPAGPSEEFKAQFRQSSFFASPMLLDEMRKRASSHQPKLSEDGEITLLVLEMMRRGCTLESIARKVSARFEQRFPDWQSALDHVGAFSAEYGETICDPHIDNAPESTNMDSASTSVLRATTDE